MPHSQPTPTPSAAAQALRERIGRENMTQSSVLATRRLDEALLRLDRAAGRTRNLDDVHEDSPLPTDRPQRAGLELDHTVAQNTSVWLEVDETGQQMRIDPHPGQSKPAAPHFKSNPTPPAKVHSHAAPNPPAASPPQSKPQLDSSFSADSLESLFTQSIDVMILPSTASHRGAPQAAAPQTVEAKVAVPQATPATTGQPESTTPATAKPDSRTAALVPQEELARPATQTVAREVRTRQPEADRTAREKQPATRAPSANASQGQPTGSTARPQSQPSAPAAPSQPPAPAALQTFVAAWQVNEFLVPSTIDQLFLAGSIAEQLAARLAKAQEQGLRTIAITSTKSGEGRSTVALGIALSVAFSGLRVAIVDADRDGVDIASDLHLDLDHSWLDAIRQRMPLEEVAVCSLADAVTLLPVLHRSSQQEAPFVSSELGECLAGLRASFDLVIVDCGPAAIADVTLCDTCLIVRDVQRTKAVEVETLAMSLRRNGSHGVGVIENFC